MEKKGVKLRVHERVKGKSHVEIRFPPTITRLEEKIIVENATANCDRVTVVTNNVW